MMNVNSFTPQAALLHKTGKAETSFISGIFQLFRFFSFYIFTGFSSDIEKRFANFTISKPKPDFPGSGIPAPAAQSGRFSG